MDGEVLINVEGVSKKFCRSLKKSLWYGLSDITCEMLPLRPNGDELAEGKRALRPAEFWAVNDVSFELRRGECLGLIGRNGAGKTTLLKMLNGLMKPDYGRIELRGRVGALIALGAGFNPILTGRENIYVNGAVLGLSKKEIEKKIDEIIDFAGVREFIDSPIQSYSSGMQVRLGFAIASALEPDILLLDEVLAVGDAAFRQKCYNAIGKLVKRCAVIFVSHSMEQVAYICSKVAVMRQGRIIVCEQAQDGLALYETDNTDDADSGAFHRCEPPVTEADFSIVHNTLGFSGTLQLRCCIQSADAVSEAELRVQFYSNLGLIAAEAISGPSDSLRITKGTSVFEVSIGPINLKRGKYLLSILLYGSRRRVVHAWSYKMLSLSIDSIDWGYAAYRIPINVHGARNVSSSMNDE